MTRPTDASIARAFWEEMEETVEAHYTPTLHEFLCRVKRRAEVLEFDAESPAGTADEWYCEQHPWALQGHDGCEGAGMLDCARWPMAQHIIRMRDQEIRELHQQYGFLAEKALADPAGTARGSEEVMQIDLDRSEEGNAVARGEEGKTSPPYWLCCGSLNFYDHHRRVCQATPEICRWGTADEHAAWQQSRPDIVFKFPQKVTTSPEPVYFSAQPTHVRCPKCTASIPVGKTCAGPYCGLKGNHED